MTVTNIDDEHHLVRFVKPAHLRRDDEGNVIGVNPSAFELRENEKYLSATWQESLATARDIALAAIKRIFEAKLTRISKAAFTTGRVAEIKVTCSEASRIRVTSEPKDWNPAYAAVRRFPAEHLKIRERLASSTWSTWALLRDIKH